MIGALHEVWRCTLPAMLTHVSPVSTVHRLRQAPRNLQFVATGSEVHQRTLQPTPSIRHMTEDSL